MVQKHIKDLYGSGIQLKGGEKLNNQYNSIPVTFEKIKDYAISDTRFTKVKIKVLHTGLNLNNSIFNKDVVDRNIQSIYNCPILAYTVYNEDGTKDYSDHR